MLFYKQFFIYFAMTQILSINVLNLIDTQIIYEQLSKTQCLKSICSKFVLYFFSKGFKLTW